MWRRSEKNPFDPELETVPLALMLDARSFAPLEGEVREQAEFLCELCSTPAVDGLFSWYAVSIDESIPQSELRPIQRDSRAVGLVGEPHTIIGGVPMWSQYDRLADRFGLAGPDREWFVYYASLSHFHHSQGRHYLVTADERVLAQVRGDEKGFFSSRNKRITSIPGALFLSGLAMKAANRVYHRGRPGPTRTSNFNVYFYLGPELVPSRGRLALYWANRRGGHRGFHLPESASRVPKSSQAGGLGRAGERSC